ncbi:MAG: hypothetical protein IT376_21510 [Polyangiaceae bacterium]|nr:hypothetical protein [Polyangiaceae bacterium]
MTARARAALAATLLALASGACGRQPPPRDDGCPPAAPAGAPVDPALLAFLSRARSAHHVADRHEDAQDLEAAIGALRGVTEGPAPAGGVEARAESREVVADTHARLADLESRRQRFDAAEAALAAGLALARETTYVRGHLLEVRGHVVERRAQWHADAGRPADAAADRKRALDAFEESMAVQAKVIECSVAEAPR